MGKIVNILSFCSIVFFFASCEKEEMISPCANPAPTPMKSVAAIAVEGTVVEPIIIKKTSPTVTIGKDATDTSKNGSGSVTVGKDGTDTDKNGSGSATTMSAENTTEGTGNTGPTVGTGGNN